MKKIIKFFFALSSLSLISCANDFLETTPTTSIGDIAAVSNAENLMTIVNGMHRDMYYRDPNFGQQGYSGYGGLMLAMDAAGEDMVRVANGSWHLDVIRWEAMANDQSALNTYSYSLMYSLIRNANTIIVNGDNATGSTTLRDTAVGEAYAYRAFAYYNLVQLFSQRYVPGGNNSAENSGVPLRLDLSVTPLKRSTTEEVYTQINADLLKSLTLLTNKSRSTKSHFNVNVVRGLMARVALTQGKWQEAADNAKLARQGFKLMTNSEYTSGFNDVLNQEWIWGQDIVSDQTDFFGDFGAYASRNFSSTAIRTYPRAINSKLYGLFPATDIRLKNFDPTGKHLGLISDATTGLKKPEFASYGIFPYTSQKFLAVSQSDARVDLPLMRAAEMYLIEAEALSNIDETASKTVLTELQNNRNNITNWSTALTGQAYKDQIQLIRRLELWGEGFRFFDLKRLGQALDRTGANHSSAIVNSVLNVPASDKKWTLLIPITEINANSLCVQNPR